MNTSMHEFIVDSISAPVAVLDEKGVIVKTNRAWQEFARKNQIKGRVDSVGVNYFIICYAAAESGEREGGLLSIGKKNIVS